jgi:hypothetical protein
MERQRLVCVDPDEDERHGTADYFTSELADIDPVVETAGTVAGAEDLLTADTAAVVTEYDLPDGTGFELIRTVRDVCPDAGCLLYTYADPDRMDTSELRGAITEYVGKESVFGTERLGRLVRETVESRSQATYPLPRNEQDRLAALRSYDLEGPSLESSLDRVTTLAADHFEVEIASINIISEHSQEFLACYGDAAEWETMDREDSVCTFTILEDDGVMTVEDMTEDPRFESRADALAAIGIRAYMGANLVSSSGLVIGPLCIYDDEPRSFSAADQAYLSNLADLAMDIIELHAQVGAGPDPGQESPATQGEFR